MWLVTMKIGFLAPRLYYHFCSSELVNFEFCYHKDNTAKQGMGFRFSIQCVVVYWCFCLKFEFCGYHWDFFGLAVLKENV